MDNNIEIKSYKGKTLTLAQSYEKDSIESKVEYESLEQKIKQLQYELNNERAVVKVRDNTIDDLRQLLIENEKKADKERKNQQKRFEELMERTGGLKTSLDGVNKTLDDTKTSLDGVNKTLDDTKSTLDDTNKKVSRIAKNYVDLDNLDNHKHPKFIILKDPNDDEMPYYAIRCQKENIDGAIKKIKEDYPDLKYWLKIPQPNAIAFYNTIKKELGGHMIRDGNWFGLKNIKSREFKKRVKKLNKKRITQ